MTVFFVVSGMLGATPELALSRFGSVCVLCGGVALLAVTGHAYTVAQNYAMLLGAAMIAGVGNCVFHPADYTIMNRRVSTARLGHAFSVHGLTGSLGWAAARVFVLAVASWGGWRAACVGASLVGLLARVPPRQSSRHWKTRRACLTRSRQPKGRMWCRCASR